MITREQILSVAYDCNAMPETMTDKSLIGLCQAIYALAMEDAAKICDTHTVDDVLVGVGIAQSCAAAIRNRSKA